ncbi:MAG: OmpA family protein [Cyclobacteriaceae bacterium]
MRKTSKIAVVSLVVAFTFIISSCENTSHGVKKGAIGAAIGGTAGAIVGKLTGNTAAGAIIGGAIGGTAGALIGKKMDKEAAEMRADLKGAKVERVGEGIKITFDSGILYGSGSSDLKAEAKANITKLSTILKKYSDTDILIIGHTDASGSEELNQTLSEKRAQSVANHLTSLGVANTRVNTQGAGELSPVADNNTEAGKRANRRVELAVYANEDMKKAAKRGDIKVN